MWRKFQLTELGTRVPLIVSVPWLTASHGQRSAAIVELVDGNRSRPLCAFFRRSLKEAVAQSCRRCQS